MKKGDIPIQVINLTNIYNYHIKKVFLVNKETLEKLINNIDKLCVTVIIYYNGLERITTITPKKCKEKYIISLMKLQSK